MTDFVIDEDVSRLIATNKVAGIVMVSMKLIDEIEVGETPHGIQLYTN